MLVETADVLGYSYRIEKKPVNEGNILTVKGKKILGSSLLVIITAAVVFAYSGTARALYRYIGSDMRATGKVQMVGSSSFELVTSGSTWPLTIITSGATDYSNGYSVFADVHTGDEVRVVADRTTGDFLALEVAKQAQPGTYGNTACDSFVISTATFERPVNNTIYVVKDNIGVSINVDNDTQVVNGTMADVIPGTQIVVSGYDCRTTGQLTAQTIEIVKNDALAACNAFGEGAIVVRNYSVLLAHDAASAKTPVVAAAVPAGTYDVYGVSFDNHSSTPWDTDAHEQWHTLGLGATNNTLVTTTNTADLPNGVDFNTTKIGNGLTVPTALTGVQFEHAVQPGTEGYQSVYPICAVFMPVGAPVPTAPLNDN